jgi:trigger factor
MQIKREQLSPTKVKLTIGAEAAELENIKKHVLDHLKGNVKVPGFREGKAPANLVEKQIDPTVLQSEFLDHGVNDLYVEAVQRENLRVVAKPEITVTKFVPYTTLEFTGEVEVVGEIKLPNYKNIKVTRQKVEVTAADVNNVIDNLRQRAATREEVKRAAKNGDEVTIDFKGVDAKTKEPIEGADGTAYPLVLGSKSFIPGFEEEVVGLNVGDEKTFDIVFPKDYGAVDLQNRKVTFTINVHKIQDLKEPKVDDEFAASVGPFKTVADLKADIKNQLRAEKQQEADRQFDNELLQKIAEKAEVVIPEALVEEEVDRIEEEEKRNVLYRGQTWQEHLDQEGVTAEEHRKRSKEGAELRVKAGLVLGEISQVEKITVTPEELEVRLMLLKNQYPDPAMQAELEKPENIRDIQSRMLTEKTLNLLRKNNAKAA